MNQPVFGVPGAGKVMSLREALQRLANVQVVIHPDHSTHRSRRNARYRSNRRRNK